MSTAAPKFTFFYDTNVHGYLYLVSTALDQHFEIQDDSGNAIVSVNASPGTQHTNYPLSFAAKKGVTYKIVLCHKNKSSGQWDANYIAPNSQLNGVAGGMNYMALASDDGGKALSYNDAMVVLHWAQYK